MNFCDFLQSPKSTSWIDEPSFFLVYWLPYEGKTIRYHKNPAFSLLSCLDWVEWDLLYSFFIIKLGSETHLLTTFY